jgi:hypothetical protein
MGVRRAVTGFDATGTETVLFDGDAPADVDLPPEVGAHLVDLWRSSDLPVDTTSTADPTAGEFELMPAGCLFRIIDLLPGDHAPMWHRTASVDFIYIAAGEATLLHDGGEATFGTGETCVQRGIRHAWVNRGTEVARLVNVSVGASLPPGVEPV